MQENIDALKSLILGHAINIVITTHQKPDADALGSSLALYNFLLQYGHHVSVITPTDYPKFIQWMVGNDKVLNFENDTYTQKKCLQLIDEADLIFCLDFGNYERIKDMHEPVAKSNARKVLIDHHLDPEIKAHFTLWDHHAAATCELIYDLIVLLSGKDKINMPIGECIYAGIMTDTGSFRFPSTSKKVHLIIAELIALGVDNSKIHRLVYDNNTEEKLRFLGYSLAHKLYVLPQYHTAYIVINSEELKKYNSQTGDTEGLVNYALSIEHVYFAAIIIEREDMVKLSFRSSGDFSVNNFAHMHFEGGGHKNAAGGKSILSLEQTVNKFLSLLPMHQKELQSEYN
ncbi:MAG: bifunctional oligoribonuclease/PAP phosphatase NrnA [Cytophagales bacterium]|nr:bifunctional oligoribonuclease/PAP phosphatase NrnA [Cytophagales bacterium]